MKPAFPLTASLRKKQEHGSPVGLVIARVNDGQIEALLGEFGVNFTPTPEYLAALRKAGAGDALVKAIASARRFDATSGEPASRTKVLHYLEQTARLISENDASKTRGRAGQSVDTLGSRAGH